MIPVVDIFAGPGGLGEGFSSSLDRSGRRRFALALSIEKDIQAHATLRLRAFRRLFHSDPPAAYQDVVRGTMEWVDLQRLFPKQAALAEAEARCMELGREEVDNVRSEIERVLPRDGKWVLIGGPPCQAYSLVGRARNKGVVGYRPELDHRQTLYVEYLQILADHGPPVFVMENVKGLLSARLESQQLFQRILEDLGDPYKALKRENRQSNGSRPRYSIRAVIGKTDELRIAPSDFVVRAEEHGIPQRRHRVILVGIRDDIANTLVPLARTDHASTVREALRDIPRVRSGLSKEMDSDQAWFDRLTSIREKSWLRKVDREVRDHIQDVIDSATRPAASRGADFLDIKGRITLNHSTRSHIRLDLERYMFASAFAAVTKTSPVLSDFPPSLLPAHLNVDRAMGNGLFADRFRVQLIGQPATTITSHISKDGHYYIHPDSSQCRSLTVREAARLQSFPDDYFFCGPRTSQYHQVGNAVPPQLARLIADAVGSLLGSA